MKTNKRLAGGLLCVIISAVAVLVCAFNSLGVTYSRFNKTAMTTVIYGEDYNDKISLSKEGRIFDFGVWEFGNSEDLTHRIVFGSDEPLNGKLRFVWDSVTASKKDITVLVSNNVLDNGVYNVSEEDGRIELPMSFIISTTRSGVAYLDVAWIPTGSNGVAATARYYVTLNADSIAGENNAKPSFNVLETKFITNNLLQISLDLPENINGAMLSVGSSLVNKFKKGTTYFTEEYPQGVKLLRDSILYLQTDTKGQIKGIIDLGKGTANSSVNVTAGTTTASYTTTSQARADGFFEVALEQPQPILSKTNNLKFTVTEPLALSDNLWNSQGSPKAEIVWQIERLEDGVFKKVSPNENLTVLANQNVSGGIITVSAPTGRQPAGTYKLTVLQIHNGYTLGQYSITFFIDYR